ncbi:hypothetical protein [Psychroserpens mesophilus]|uniref:hypothetical protein n=1 Tax=Psychroserpens mesophilus TaxID=325473 RepID=UPI003D64E09B
MKKLLFILCVSFLIGNAFATETESDIKESSTVEFVSNSSKAFFAKKCCRRTVTNDEGESWSARRCVTNDDSNIAMGQACQMAAYDANTAMQQASSYTVTVVAID